MKIVKHAYTLLFCIIWILTGQAWSNEAPKIFVQSKVKHIVAGGHHSLAIDENGNLWAWGNNGSGRLGNADAGLKASIPVPVNTTDGAGQLSNVISVDGGFSHTIALLSDGCVMAWGNNNMKQLGNSSISQSSYLPVYVNGPGEEAYLKNVIAVAAGNYHSAALCSDGTVWTWGTNTHGQLGNNTQIERSQSRPMKVTNSDGTGFLSDIAAISAGAYHTLALSKSGIVYAWGNNESGQLGLGSDAMYLMMPFPINELTDITHISAGASHSLARKSNGTVWAWGKNESGQLGYPTNNSSNSRSPHQVLDSDGVNNLINVVNISAGGSHSLALKDDSTMMAWGNNSYGQIGDGSETSTLYPTSVKRTNGLDLLENIVDINSGANFSLARLKDGHLMAWGENNEGQLGNNGKNAILPAYVLDENAQSSLTLGLQYFYVYVNEDQVSDEIPFILRDTDGQQVTLSAISSNADLMIPSNFEFNHNNQPFTLPTPSEESVDVLFSFKTVADKYGSGQISIVATDSLGASDTAYLMIIVLPINDPPIISNVEDVQLNEDTISGLIPFTILDVDGDDLTVSAQSLNTLLIPKEGLVLSGSSSNRYIQIYPTPNQSGASDILLSVSDPFGMTSQTHFYVNVNPINDIPEMQILPGICQIDCGYFHNIAIQNDWTVWAWGYNGSGQLGDGTDTPHNLPIQVKGPDGMGWLTDVIAVAGGNQHSAALTGDGHVLTWGGNSNGQLGNGTFEPSFVPTYVLNDYDDVFADVTDIASGANHLLLLTEENELFAWGKNENGQLADNSPASYNRPIRINGLPSDRIIQIAAGDTHSMVLLDNGEIWSWGDNSFGQLGIGNAIAAMVPTRVLQENGSPLSNIIFIAAGSYHSLALSNEGFIWAFGKNSDGQLGIGSNVNISKPVKVQHPDNGISLSDVVYIAAGGSHSLAIQNSGLIWSWGNNKYGQLGIGTKENQALPQIINHQDIPSDQIFIIDAGTQHTVLHAKNIWAWGANYSLQLGTGTSNGSLVPIQTRSSDGSDVFSPGVFPLEFYTVDGVPAKPVLVSLHDLETSAKDLVLTVTSYDTQILPQDNIVIQGNGANRQVILTPDNERTGKVVVELSVSDNTDQYSKNLTLGVNKFSVAPTITNIDNLVINEDQTITDILFTIDDPDTPIDQLTVQVTSSNIELVPNHPEKIILSGIDKDKNLTITPLDNKYGETLISIRVSDGINITKLNFKLTVLSINDPPSISSIEEQEILSEEFSIAVGFTILDFETEPEQLTTWAISSDPAIVPNDSLHLIISGDASQRTLAITPSKEEAGALTITVYVSDGVETRSTSFKLTVQSYRKSPQLSEIENQTMMEDSEISVDFVVTDADSDLSELTFQVVSSNKYVIPNSSENLSLSGEGSNRTLYIKPKADQAGSVRISIEVRDLDDLYDQTSFMINVQNINDPPTLSNIEDMEIKENESTPPIEFTIYDPDLAASNLDLTVTSNNKLLVPNDRFHLDLSGDGENRTLIITPLENTTGETTIRLQLTDGIIPVWESFVLRVSPQNFPPEFSPIGLQSTEVNTELEIRFDVTDAEMPSYLLQLSATSSDPDVVPNDSAHLKLETGADNERILTITPLENESGQLTITLMLQDDLSTVPLAFTLVVNHPPSISSVSEQETDEDVPLYPHVLFTVSDADTNVNQLQLTARSANEELIPNDDDHLVFQNNGYYQYLSVVPAPNQCGTTHITVSITDGYSVRTTGFDITVRPINDPPFILPVAPVITYEDTAISSLKITIGDLETSADLLALSFLSDNESLLPIQNIQVTGQSATRYLSLTPTSNQYGSAKVTLKVSDTEGLSADREFLFQVKSVNDAPAPQNQSFETRINVPFTGIVHANDVDGDPLTYVISAKPEKGNVTLLNASTGAFTYQPLYEIYGSDSFLFVASDGFETSVEGTVTIQIHDDMPPEIILDGLNPDYIMKGNIFVDRGVKSAYDKADGNLKDEVETIGVVNTSVTGTYHLMYRVMDKSGNMAQATREIVVMEDSGKLLGTVENIPDLITDPDDDIRVQLLDAISNQVLREAQLTIDYQKVRFSFVYLPYQTYVLRLIVSDHNDVPSYLTEIEDKILLFQNNNQEVVLNVPELTETDQSNQLVVSLVGDYKRYDTYQYTLIDYLSGKTIIEKQANDDQFHTYLTDGSYRLIIIAKGYEPFEYEHINGNPYVRLYQEDVTISAVLKESPQYHPDDVRMDISHTLFETDTESGFNMWFVRKAYNSDADFRITIQSDTDEITMDYLDGIDLIDNHPYIYTWSIEDAETQPPLYAKKEPMGMDTRYTVIFHFYQGTDLIQDYTIHYILQAPGSTQIAPEKDSLQDFVNDTVRYETISETKFYPLAGVDFNISVKDSTGTIKHKGVSIPPIPLDYLEISDSQKDLSASDEIIANVKYYTFGGDGVSDGISIDFKTLDGDSVLFNSKDNRNVNAPIITLPLHLNRNSSYYEGIQQNNFSYAQEMLHVVVKDSSDPSAGFQSEDLPFVIQDDGFVLVKIKHLSTITLEINDNWNAFKNKDLDNGRCFINTLYLQNQLNIAILWFILFVCGLNSIRKRKGKQS
jgi:alpha-tubulin suppressor-like RCC1 family protein